MSTIALVTSSAFPTLYEDDHRLVSALSTIGYEVVPVVWEDRSALWSSFSMVILRSTWDYHTKIDAFCEWLDRMEAQECRFWNPISMIRWNLKKTYLRDLAAKGLRIVPTTWLAKGSPCDLVASAQKYDSEEIVVKPVISAGAYDTFRWKKTELPQNQALLDELLAKQEMMLQPFLPEFLSEGEWSFLFFGGQFSHALQKRPKEGDFRVQEIHGGRSSFASPPNAWIAEAFAYLADLSPIPLYARVDLIRHQGQLLLVELELIEPSLSFYLDPPSALRLASAIYLYDVGLVP